MPEVFDSEHEPKDRTPLIWAGILALVGLMVFALWFAGRPSPTESQVRARHILVKFNPSDPADRSRAMELVTDLRQRIVGGADFALLARDYSEDPGSASRGGDLGYAPKGIYAENFDKFCWTAPVGQLSEIVVTQHGFHLIEVTDRFISEADLYEQELEERAREVLEGGGGAS
jgi:parvulin-like peptidyl-prolyl isomerase